MELDLLHFVLDEFCFDFIWLIVTLSLFQSVIVTRMDTLFVLVLVLFVLFVEFLYPFSQYDHLVRLCCCNC